VGRDKWPWRRRAIIDAVVLRKDVRLVVNLAAATEVETIDAGTKMRAICFRTSKRKHAHTGLTAPA